MSRTALLPVPEADTSVSVRFDGPLGEAPLLVFGHGAGAGIDHPLLEGFAAAFAASGLAVLRFQFPFMERRGGRGFGRDPLPVAIATVRAAVAEGRRHCADRPLFAGGHSYGGRMCSHAAVEEGLPGVSGLVLLSFPLHGAKRPDTQRAAHLAQVGLPMCFVSGERDAMARAPLLEEIVASLPAASLMRIPGADHGWNAPKRIWPDGPQQEVARVVAEWASKV
ncbi:MAG: alpha/beta family hydrolase [Gammaproteobacteria bacterium]|nr:alpha/beta family hydrolase [Gammaproteobacteria bacterium]